MKLRVQEKFTKSLPPVKKLFVQCPEKFIFIFKIFIKIDREHFKNYFDPIYHENRK